MPTKAKISATFAQMKIIEGQSYVLPSSVLCQLGTRRQCLITIMVRCNTSSFNWNALEYDRYRHAKCSYYNAEHPELPAQRHCTGKCSQELNYEYLEHHCGEDHRKKYPALKHAFEYVYLFDFSAVYLIENLAKERVAKGKQQTK